MKRDSLVILSVFMVLSGVLLSFSSISAKPVAPDPDGAWAGQADFGLRFAWENANAVGYPSSHYWANLDVGVGLNPYDPYKQDWTSSGNATFNARAYLEGGGPYLVVVDNLRADETYVFGLDFVSGVDRPNSANFKWELEDASNIYFPSDYLMTIDNINGAGIADNGSPDINMRATSSHVFTSSNTANIIYENGANASISLLDDAPMTYGAVENYTVTVTNNSSYYDQDFDLSANTSLSGWNVWFDDDPLSVSAGSSGSTTMHVEILSGGTNDISVTADSALIDEDNTGTVSVTGPTGPGVDVEISPASQSGFPGDSLSYTVDVKNIGGIVDNYSLSITDDAGWGDNVSLANVEINDLAPGEVGNVSLDVTIPDDASYTDHEISVEATSDYDSSVQKENSCTAHVDPVRKVDVLIQPDNNAGLPGNPLNFTVVVTNTGSLSGGFGLSVSGDQDWQPGIFPEGFDISPGDSENATLSVTVPQGAVNGDSVTITVTATSTDNSQVSDSASCTAMANISRGVSITELTPSENSGIPGENVSFSLRVRNIGELSDNYALTVQNSWDYSISPGFLVLEGGKSGGATLTVTIPSDASPESTDQITVTATSQEDQNVSASRSCIASSKAYLDVSASINPENRSGSRGDNLLYTVDILNTGNLPDNYDLTVVDDFGWDLSISENSLENVQPGDNRNVTLTVKIPENAQADALDNVVVTATSQENENITGSASCVAYSLPITRSVEVSISPSEKEWMVGKSTIYTVTVKNTGDVSDNYILTLSDNASWNASLSVESVEDVLPGENKTVSLNVTIPSATSPDTVDNITVTAISQNDSSASDSASCIGKVLILKSVKVEVSSSFKSGRPGEEVVFEVIVTNTGQADGNFSLTATATPGWSPRIEPATLMLSSGQSDNAKLVVEIPSNIGENETGSLEARASLMEDSDITSADTGRVGVSGSPIGGGISLPGLWTIIWIIIIIAVIAVVIIVVRYLLGRGGQEKRSRVLSDLGGQKKKDRSRVLRELSS